MVPQLEWEIFVCHAQSTDEVIFEGLDGSFHGVDSVIISLHELELTVLFLEKLFYGCTGLIVCDAKGGFVSVVSEDLEDRFLGSDNIVI